MLVCAHPAAGASLTSRHRCVPTPRERGESSLVMQLAGTRHGAWEYITVSTCPHQPTDSTYICKTCTTPPT